MGKRADSPDLKQRLDHAELGDNDIDSCQLGMTTKHRLVQMLEKYKNVFSNHHLDCGKAKGFVYRVRLKDDRKSASDLLYISSHASDGVEKRWWSQNLHRF